MENVFDLKKFNQEKKWRDFKDSVKEKGKRALDWCSANKELLVIAIPTVCGTIKMVSSTARKHMEQRDIKCREYDRRTAHYTYTKRPLKPWEVSELERRYRNGETKAEILRSMNLVR